ncbi:hypothetical protein CQA49_06850 [Helicobacter sp. MIT 00-7814]|uniref:hypothetical protein n=1 Tax=unclassified Helicobacter TaxID=2593540 RepID=UPI000E1E328D|nr:MULTISPECIES: hypothetical protein [unclassified Helicobacter]RDU53360.1 hypothetical protein CQA49_06850 [Helicobacter sp. MIT 00-7814]RDU54181.1 hypothetical protein CQA37_06090 [Helicobacter sp. MIT 99-10781]
MQNQTNPESMPLKSESYGLFLNLNGVAEILGTSTRTAKKFVKQANIPQYKLNRKNILYMTTEVLNAVVALRESK